MNILDLIFAPTIIFEHTQISCVPFIFFFKGRTGSERVFLLTPFIPIYHHRVT